MEHTKDILCPDCELENISQKENLEWGKCKKCHLRELYYKRNKLNYIPFKLLSEKEQKNILRLRVNSARYANNQKVIKNEKEAPKIEDIKTKPNKIVGYTDDVINTLKDIVTDNMTLKEILYIIQNLYPQNEGFSISNLRYRLGKLGKTYKYEDKYIYTHNLNNNENKTSNLEVGEGVTIKGSDIISNIITTEANINNSIENAQDYLENMDITENSIDAIKEEVQGVINRKSKLLNCYVENNYTTEDYLNAINMLLYLKQNLNTVYTARRSQVDIFDAYQLDVLHECENVELAPGDTYIQDKLHILRQMRRAVKNDAEDLIMLKPLLALITDTTLETIKENFDKQIKLRNNVVYCPEVDVKMTKKYDWAKSSTLASGKTSRSIIKPTHTINDDASFNRSLKPVKQLKNLKKFRILYKVSGGGQGAYKHLYKDISATSITQAREMGDKFINNLKAKNKDLLISDYNIIAQN